MAAPTFGIPVHATEEQTGEDAQRPTEPQFVPVRAQTTPKPLDDRQEATAGAAPRLPLADEQPVTFGAADGN